MGQVLDLKEVCLDSSHIPRHQIEYEGLDHAPTHDENVGLIVNEVECATGESEECAGGGVRASRPQLGRGVIHRGHLIARRASGWNKYVVGRYSIAQSQNDSVIVIF